MRSLIRWLAPVPVMVVLILSGPFPARAAAQSDSTKSNTAIKPVPKKEKWWQQLHHSFQQRARQGNVDVLFLGDSITQGWGGEGRAVWKERFEPLKAANFGIGGDQTQHVLWRLREGKELHGIQPRAVVLMIGTNNMGSNSAEQIAAGIVAIVHEIR